MANENVIQATFDGFYKTYTEPSWFIDHGMELSISGIDLPDEFECHFSNSRSVAAKRQIGENGVVTIPDEYFLSNAAQIFCWIYLHPTVDSGVTEYEIVIPLRPRSNVDPAEPTQEQQDIVDQAIAALNVAMAETSADAESASASATAAQAAVDSVLNMTVSADTLPSGSDASVTKSVVDDAVHLAFGIPQGAQGVQGEQGVQGPTGATPNFTIGTVQTLLPTQDATATITGTAEAPVLNLGIPKGYSGDATNLAADYSSNKIYAVGDYCFHNGSLYRCTTPITTAEAWTAAHWTAAVLGDDVGDLKGALKGIIDTKNDFLWVKGSWSGGTLYTSGNAFLKRRATANVIQLNADGIIGIKDTSTYRYGVSFYDSNGDFVRETAWLQAPISVPKNTKITINIKYNDESSASPTDPLKNNLWDTLYICAEDSFASLKNDFMKASANTNNLLKVTNVDANNIEFIALDLGQDVTFPDGVVFSFFANNLVPISTSNAVVDLRKSDGTHQYCAFNNCLDRYDNRFPSNAVANGRYYTDPSVYGAGVTFRYVEIRKASTSGFLSDFMLTAGQNRMQEFVEAKSAIDYEARNKLNISAGEKSYQYDGDEIKLRRNGYNVGALFYSKTMPLEAVSIQDFAIYNNVLFQFYANDIVRLINIENGEEIATYSIQSGHGDTACFSNEFYASGDEFPLLYITAETNKPSFYVNRVTRSGSELIATYYWGGWSDCGYFPGCCIDGRVLWLVGYKEPSYSDATNNEMIVSAWDLDNCVENGDGTLTPSLIKTFNVPFFTTAQGQSMMDGKIFVVSSRTSNPHETKIYVIDTESEKISSVVNNVPTYISEHEAEGIDFLFDKKSWNYDMIVSTPNIYYKLVF